MRKNPLKIKFFPFLKIWLATILYKKKTIKRGKIANMEERQRKKESDGERLKIDSQMKSKFWPVRMREKQKKLFNQAISRKICLF